MEMLPVIHDSGGIDPDDLDRVLGASGAKVIYLKPVCHNPIGFEMSEERRRAVLAIAEKHDARIVEDDIYSVYAAKGGPTFKELAPSRTYYLNSISKCLTPLLRVGIIAPPADRIGSIAKAVGAVVWGASPHGLELACALIEVGADTIVAAILRSEAKARVQLAQRVLALELPPNARRRSAFVAPDACCPGGKAGASIQRARSPAYAPRRIVRRR